MKKRQEIVEQMAAARGEPSRDRSIHLLGEALKMCDAWQQDRGGDNALILRSQILAELAEEEDEAVKRTKCWRAALDAVNSGSCRDLKPCMVEQYASISVDWFQDRLCNLSEVERRRLLHSARAQIDIVMNGGLDQSMRAALLARKSSVLRQMSRIALTHSDKRKRLDESVRCARLAVDTTEEPGTLLELGLSEWGAASLQRTDADYVTNLEAAERCFTSSVLDDFEPARLALARFYRMTFRPMDACEAFAKCIDRAWNIRRVLRTAHMYAEAATQLWYGGFPEGEVNMHLQDASDIVHRAISSGYKDARTVLSAAYITAIMEGADVGASALSGLCQNGEMISWDRVVALVAQASFADLPSLGLALGIDQSATLSRLGTFAVDFLDNPELAESLYRTALRQDSGDVVALTNLARILVARDDTTSLLDASRLLSTAASVADRRFRWWRVVREDLDKKMPHGDRKSLPPLEPSPAAGKLHLIKQSQIRQRFRRAEHLPPQQRGYELERLVHEQAKLTFGISVGPYRNSRGDSVKPQIDGYFEHNSQPYRVECKWESHPCTAADVVLFCDKVDAAGVSCLLMSIGGFDKSALERAREMAKSKPILLMDGDEIRAVMNGTLNFDYVVDCKRRWYNQHTGPYHKVLATPEITETA